MIDATRWVLAEAWLALGLRLRWSYRFQRDNGTKEERDRWQRDEELRCYYLYEGGGVWVVAGEDRTTLGYTRPTSPQLGTETMRHELAHYLVATTEERARENFGLLASDNEAEERALQAEQVIDAIVAGAGRIASAALQPRRTS